MQHDKKQKKTVIIIGPTASGKTALSELLAQELKGEIVNSDMAQMYEALEIGTAKPNYKSYPYKAHLFDLYREPTESSAATYRKLVTEQLEAIEQRNSRAIIVGGTLFYIKALFFKLTETNKNIYNEKTKEENQASLYSWEKLHALDPLRAAQIHQNDQYRVKRALDLFYETGEKPSALSPRFDPIFKEEAVFIIIKPERTQLKERIALRTELMLTEQDWLSEAEKLMGTPWQEFVCQKGFIGYNHLFNYLNQRDKKEKKDIMAIKDRIISETWSYAKRQICFWRSFEKQLLTAAPQYMKQLFIITDPITESEEIKKIIENIKNIF